MQVGVDHRFRRNAVRGNGQVNQAGILLARFSGGYPSANGDLGIAKNSYLIEDGEIKYPISESMVSGNFADMLMNVKAVSKERVDSGRSIFPWVAVSGATISGK